MSNDIEVKKETHIAKTTPAARGFEEGVDKEDLILPRATLLQAMSPQVADGKENCRPGVIINNLTNEVLPETFVPIFKWTEYLKFNPMDSKAEGFNPDFEPKALIWKTTTPTAEQAAECKFGEAGEKPTAMKVMNFLCYFVGYEMPVVLSFAKTSYRTGKELISMMQCRKGDMFSNRFRLIGKQKEKSGIKYFIYEIRDSGKANKEEFAIAEAWYEQFRGKEIKAHDEGIAQEPEETRPY